MSVPLNDEVLRQLAQVSISARQAVENILSGSHRSINRGLSVEFAGHREYAPGDDIRHLDWFVFARSDRYEIRQYEEETKLRVSLILDASGSMGYSSGGLSKLDFARSLMACVGYLLVRQSDTLGALICDTEVRTELPSAGTMGGYLNLLKQLAETKPERETGLAACLEKHAPSFKMRGLVLILTDGFEDPDQLLGALRLLRHRRQDVRLFQVLDPAEETFPFRDTTEFVGLENEPRLKLDADRVRDRYLAAFREHQQKLSEGCASLGISRTICRTTDDLAGVVVQSFLGLSHV